MIIKTEVGVTILIILTLLTSILIVVNFNKTARDIREIQNQMTVLNQAIEKN